MAKAAIWLSTIGAFVVIGGMACSSSSGGGGSGGGSGCSDMSGIWTMSGNCPTNPSSCTVSQSGCSASLQCDTGSTTATVSGNSMSFVFDGAQCNGSVTNGTFSGSCSASGSTCTVSGTCSNGKCGVATGSGGSGGTGPGEGGAGGVPPGGSGGTGGSGTCSDVPYSNDAVCESCMEGACCSQMGGCSTGTACYSLLECYVQNCQSAADPTTCIQTTCASQLESGGPALDALYTCEENNCSSQCATGA